MSVSIAVGHLEVWMPYIKICGMIDVDAANHQNLWRRDSSTDSLHCTYRDWRGDDATSAGNFSLICIVQRERVCNDIGRGDKGDSPEIINVLEAYSWTLILTS